LLLAAYGCQNFKVQAEGEMATLTSLTSNANPNKSFEVRCFCGNVLLFVSFSHSVNTTYSLQRLHLNAGPA
jgi:hypothetical protein